MREPAGDKGGGAGEGASRADRILGVGGRQSLLSVVAEAYTAWFLLTAALYVGGMAWMVFVERAVYPVGGGDVKMLLLMEVSQTVAKWAAVNSFFIVEGGRQAMVAGKITWDLYMARKRRRLAEALAQGREEGLSEGVALGREEGLSEGVALGREEERERIVAAFSAWNARRLDAEGRGERFDEPPPGI